MLPKRGKRSFLSSLFLIFYVLFLMFVFYGRSSAIPFTESTTKYRYMEKKINIHFLSKGQSVRKKKSTLNVRLEIRLFEGLFAC